MIRLAVRCSPTQAEAVLDELLQLAPGGVEEEHGPGWVEYAIYGAEGELPDLGAVEAVDSGGTLEVRAERIPDDWADRWRDFHSPTRIADRVVIRPSWHDPVPGDDVIDVVIEPGQAFGTGAHPTTRMCVELLLELADAGEAGGGLVDLGTGSGVLAIAAARLGWDPVMGVDYEAAAVEAAAQNAGVNGVTASFEPLNLREQDPPAAPTVVANLTSPLLNDVARRLPASVRRVVCSGLLEREVDGVAAAFATAGLTARTRRIGGDWAALLLERGAGGPG